MTTAFVRVILAFLPAICFPASPTGGEVVIPSGSVLRSRLDGVVRIRPGAAVSAILTEPLYVGETLALPQGTAVKGRINSVESLPFRNRGRRLLGGDFTPPKTARVTFDQIILADGTITPIWTNSVIGVNGIRNVVYGPSKPRPSLGKLLSTAARPIKEPNKLQRLSRAAAKALPYHPEYLDRGVVFDTTLLTELTTSIPAQPGDIERSAGNGLLHVRLLTPLDSSSGSDDKPVRAVVTRPYYAAGGALLFPPGTTLDGRVNKVSPSGRWKKHGTLRFEFRSVTAPGGQSAPLIASVAGIEAMHAQSLWVGSDGDITAKNSRVGQVLAVTSLVGPVISSTDPSVNKTAFARAGQGRAVGLIGSGTAQASSSTATGIAFFGAAVKIYDSFLAHGAEIELPRNTPVVLRINP